MRSSCGGGVKYLFLSYGTSMFVLVALSPYVEAGWFFFCLKDD